MQVATVRVARGGPLQAVLGPIEEGRSEKDVRIEKVATT